MNILELPEDILIIIIRQLDMQTIYSLYCTCRQMRSKMRAPGVLKHLNFTLNKLAHVKTLDSSLVKLSHIQELTLAGVDDLQQSCFLPAVKQLKNLLTIDVSYTIVDLLYFNDIYSVCPTIKNAKLNFVSKTTPNSDNEYLEIFEAKLSVEEVKQCQKTFKHMVNLHFIGTSENLLKRDTPVILLNSSNLDTLKFTIIKINKTPTIVCPTECSDNMKIMKLDDKIKLIKFKSFFIKSLKLEETSIFDSINTSPIIREISESSVEKLFVVETCHHTERNYRNYCLKPSSIFESHLIDTKLHFVEPNMLKPLYAPAHALIMFWNKDHHTFDDAFFNKLLKSLNYAFPHDCTPYLPSSTPVPTSNNWFCLKPIVLKNSGSGPSEPKRSYFDTRTLDLHYDDIFRTKSSLELSLIMGDLYKPVSLSEQSNYLKKLTYLDLDFTLHGKASPKFFKVLYKCCINLVTLSIKAPHPPAKRDVFADRTPFSVSVSKGLHKAKRLKNFKLDDKYIEFDMIYKGLAECNELENVVLLDCKYNLANVGDFEILFKKPKLKMYMLAIIANFTRPSYARLKQKFRSLSLKDVQFKMHDFCDPSFTQYFHTEFPFELRHRHLEM